MADLATGQSTDLQTTSTDVVPESPEEDEGGVMTLREHLVELRNRLVIAVLAIAVGMGAAWYLVDPLLGFYISQFCDASLQDCRLTYLDPTEGLMTAFKISFYIGLIIALPVVLFQIVRYVAPGLTKAERRVLYIALPFVVVLFAAGAIFALMLISPAMLRFLTALPFKNIRPDLRAVSTINLAMDISLWMGIVFQLPLIMFSLARFGVVSSRRFFGFWRYAAVISLVVAAIVTPTPDPINMGLVAVPVMLLYFLGIGLARLAEGRRGPAEALPQPS